MQISNSYNPVLRKEINKVSEQISSGKKISKGFEDASLFKKTIDLDSDIQFHSRLKESAEHAKAVAQYTDSTLGQMVDTLDTFKSKLLAYGGRVHSRTSREALVDELKSLRNHLYSLANTQVDGEYLFSGTNSKVPPIDGEGNYQGNNKPLTITTDRFQKQEYSIDGESLFLGYDRNIHSQVSTNVRKLNQTSLQQTPPKEEYITLDDSILDMTGKNEPTTFYLSGTRPDGTSFKHKFQVDDPANVKVSDLAEEIRLAFNDEVTVELSNNGQFIIRDKESGNGKLNFFMVGSTENVDDISQLSQDNLIEFVKTGSDISANTMDTAKFRKDGNLLKSNVQQFISVDEGYATSSTTLDEVASGSLLNRTLNIEGKNINGEDVTASITFGENTTTATINGATYQLEGGAKDFTYQQLNEVLEIAFSGVAGSGNFSSDVITAEKYVDVRLNSHGELEIRDLTSSTSKMEVAIYDSGVYDFSANEGVPISFNSNKAIDFDRPTVDIFKSIDDAIEAVEQDLYHPDSSRVGFEDNLGLQGAIDNITHVTDHITKERAKIGAKMQNINYTLDRVEALSVNMQIVQNETISTDFAEASSYFQALSLNYQAMLQTVARVQNLSLVNYL